MIDVIIPFFNRPEYTKTVLDSLYRTDHGVPISPILVDNGSRKKTKDTVFQWKAVYADLPEDIRQKVAEPRIVSLTENKGFSGALNAGISAYESSEFVVIMHNDCIPFDGWAKEMLDCFTESDEDVAIVVPRTCYANEHSPCIPDLRKKFEAIKPSNKERVTSEEIEKLISEMYPDKKALLESLRGTSQLQMTYSPEISSFCMMTRSSHFSKYGKFDEDFWPRGFEDKFWFRAMERDGFVCMISNRAYVHHMGNITSDGPGFSYPDVMKLNDEKFRAKCLEKDKAMGQSLKAEK